MKPNPKAATSLALFCSLLACSYSEHRDLDTLSVEEVTIDTGIFLDAEPGVGVGAFAQYESGGHWELFTTCDTELSGYGCDYDILLSVPEGELLTEVKGADLESSDELFSPGKGVLHFRPFTRYDYDRVLFRTAPGQTVRFDVLLDGFPDPEALIWGGYGGVQTVAPTTPLDLKPSEP